MLSSVQLGLTCTFRASCYSTFLSWAHTPVINWDVCPGQKDLHCFIHSAVKLTNSTKGNSFCYLSSDIFCYQWSAIYLFCLQNLKALRHPDILKYISSGENIDGSSYLVTEQVEPLELHFPSLSPIELCAGLHSVLKALVFLHDTVRQPLFCGDCSKLGL